MTRPNSVTTTYGYGNLSRLLSAAHALSGTTLHGASYTVDNAGNRTSRTPPAFALQTATKVGPVTVDMGGTACKVPSAAEYIHKVEKREAIGKKRKTAKC